MSRIVPADSPEARNRPAGRKPRNAGTPRGMRRRIRRWLIAVLVLFVLATWLPIMALRWFEPPATAFMLFNNQVTMEDTRHEWRDRGALGDTMALAVMAAEDQNFPNHYGVDFDALGKAVDERQRGGRVRGASGITQQLAKNLFLWPGRNVVRKGLEAYLAVVMDLLLPKKRILELYLNVVELGPGIYGVPAASQRYFGVEPQHMSPDQAALLAAVLPNPNRLHADRPSDYVRSRQEWIRTQATRLRRDGWLHKVNWR